MIPPPFFSLIGQVQTLEQYVFIHTALVNYLYDRLSLFRASSNPAEKATLSVRNVIEVLSKFWWC